MVMDEKVEYFKLPFYKRVTSLFMDLMLTFTVFLLLLILFSTIIPSFMNKDEKLSYYNNEMNKIIYSTEFYEIKEDKLVPNYEDESISSCFEFSGNLDKYIENKKKSGLFIYENGRYVEKGTEEELKTFYESNWNEALKLVQNMDEYQKFYVPYSKRVNMYMDIYFVVPAVVSVVGLLILVPFFNKDGKTVSKMIFKISVTNNELQPLNRLQIFMRQFFFVLCIFTFIPSIISLIMFLFEKEGKTIHDFVTLSRVIDSNVKKALLKRDKKIEVVEKDKLVFKEK